MVSMLTFIVHAFLFSSLYPSSSKYTPLLGWLGNNPSRILQTIIYAYELQEKKPLIASPTNTK